MITAAATGVKRYGTAKHMALAMYLRPEGATQAEVLIVTGDSGVNVYRDCKTAGWPALEVGKRGGVKVYKMSLPSAKPAKVKQAAKQAAKAAGNFKPVKAKAAASKAAKAASKAASKVRPYAKSPTTPNGQPEAGKVTLADLASKPQS